MYSLFNQNIIKDNRDDIIKSMLNMDFAKVITDKNKYPNINLQDINSLGSFFLSSDSISSISTQTLITNIYSNIYTNMGLTLPSNNNYKLYNLQNTDTASNFGVFTIPLLNKTTKVFDQYCNVMIFNPWFLLCNDYCITNGLNSITPTSTLSKCCNNGIFSNWLSNSTNMSSSTQCQPAFTSFSGNTVYNLKLAFQDSTTNVTPVLPNIISVDDGKYYYCMAVFNPIQITSNQSDYTIAWSLIINPQYSNKCYSDNSLNVNNCTTDTCKNSVVSPKSFPDIIYNSTFPYHDCAYGWITDDGSIASQTVSSDLTFSLVLPYFSFDSPKQECFDFINDNSSNTFFSRGIYDTNSTQCSFPDYSKNNGYYTLDQYLKQGIYSIPSMIKDPTKIYYADSGIQGLLTNNSTFSVNHTYTDNWANGTNIMDEYAPQTINNIDTRSIRLGCNPGSMDNTCKNDTGTGSSGTILANDRLYSKIGTAGYISLSNIGQNVQNAWVSAQQIDGLNIDSKNIFNRGTNAPFPAPGNDTTLYPLITGDTNGLFDKSGNVNNTQMYLTDSDTTKFPTNNPMDWTDPKSNGKYQKVRSSRVKNDGTDPYYFNVADSWSQKNSFTAESNFSNYYNGKKFNFCASGVGADNTAPFPIYDPASLFGTSSIIPSGNTSFVKNGTLWKCDCPSEDNVSLTGYCIPKTTNWYYKTELAGEYSNPVLFTTSGINGVSYESLNDSTGQPYSRIITLRGPLTYSPGDDWKEVKGLVPNETNLYNVVNILSTGGNKNLPTDLVSYGDMGIVCPSPNSIDSTGSYIQRPFSFSNQLTSKYGSSTQILTYDTLNKYGGGDGKEEAGGATGFPKFLIDSGKSGYDSPGDTDQTKNTYTCSNHILNSGRSSSSFPGSMYYEDFYDSSCPLSKDPSCGIGPYDINNPNGGQAFPYWNQQSIPVATQNIYIVIYDYTKKIFVSPTSVEYINTFGKSMTPSYDVTNFPLVSNILGFISEPSLVCDPTNFPSSTQTFENTNIPSWATGKMGSNDDYSDKIGYIPSCFLVGTPLAEVTKPTSSSNVTPVPTISTDIGNIFNSTADQGVITVTYGQDSIGIKNDLSLVRSNDSPDTLQKAICFQSGITPVPQNTFIPNILSIGQSIGPNITPPQDSLSKVIQGLTAPCYNLNTTTDKNTVRMNLSTSKNAFTNKVYLVISFNDPSRNIKGGFYRLIGNNS